MVVTNNPLFPESSRTQQSTTLTSSSGVVTTYTQTGGVLYTSSGTIIASTGDTFVYTSDGKIVAAKGLPDDKRDGTGGGVVIG